MSITVNLFKVTASGANLTGAFLSTDKITAIEREEYDASDLLLDEPLIIEKSIEYQSVLSAEDSQSSLSFAYSSALYEFLTDEDILSYSDKGYGIEILLDTKRILWAALDKFSVEYDVIGGIITFSTIGWYKYWLDTYGHKTLGFISGTVAEGETIDASTYLAEYVDDTICIAINFLCMGASEVLDKHFLRYGLVFYGMTIEEFMIELQKHYAAYSFIDANKIWHFISRGLVPVMHTAIDALILDNDYLVDYENAEYNSVLVNGEIDGDDTWTGDSWLLLSAGDTVTSHSDTNTISDNFKYIDIRQKMHGSSFEFATTWLLFDTTAISSLLGNDNIYWDLYKNILGVQKVITVECLGTDYEIFDGVTIDSIQYKIFRAEINYTENKSSLTLKRTLED